VAAKVINQNPLHQVNSFFESFHCFAIGVNTEGLYFINKRDTHPSEPHFFKINLTRVAIKNQTGAYLFVYQHRALIQEQSLSVKNFQLPESGTNCEITFDKIPYSIETDFIDCCKIGYTYKYKSMFTK
jgi:hypothetical protein